MLGSMLKGAAWCATLALATVGALTFVPDESWERFPSALAHTRAQLAEFGIAPAKYRTDGALYAEAALVENEPSTSSVERVNAPLDEESVFEPRSVVRVGGGRNSFSGVSSSNFDVGALDSPVSLAARQAEVPSRSSDASAPEPKVSEENAEIRAPLFEGESKTADAMFDPNREIPAPAPVEDPSSFSPDLFADAPANPSDSNAETNAGASSPSVPAPPASIEAPLTQSLATNELNALESTVLSEKSNDLSNPPVATPLAPLTPQQAQPTEASEPNALAQNVNVEPTPGVTSLSSDASVLQAPPTRPTLAQTTNPAQAIPTGNSQVLIQNSASTADVLTVAADLERALNAAKSLNSNEQAREVLTTLNRIQRAQSEVLAEGDRTRLNEALDQLAYEAFYNPSRFLLEAPRKTAPGETLSSIAREYDVTPRLLASINGLNIDSDAPLPPGSSLKTVRGPVTAEVSIGKKELLLRFNDIYAGRFKLGVPRQATTLRGTHLVESKLTNPACDAVDTSGATISIPGGSPDNPLGSCWIGLSGGYGLQGTNRPELIGTIVQENGGFVFSNLEISQLDVLLPIGAAISFVD